MTGPEWERDAEGRIIEYGVVRLPDRIICDLAASEKEANDLVIAHYAWKEERRRDAEENRKELDAAPPLPPTNIPWMDWTKATKHRPVIQEMEWEVRRRSVTDWLPAADWPAIPKGGTGIRIEVHAPTCPRCGGQDGHHQPHCPHHPRNW